MSNNIISGIRTIVPVVIGAFLGWIAKLIFANFGIEITEENLTSLTTALSTVVTVVTIGLYYAVARWLETRYSGRFGWLLGSPHQPTYTDSDAP